MKERGVDAMVLLAELKKPLRTPKPPKYNQVGYLFFLCEKYGLEFDYTQIEAYVASSIYATIYKKIEEDPELLDIIVENWILISRTLKFKTNLPANFIRMNLYFLRENLDTFIVAANIIRTLSFHLDYLQLRMRLEEKCVVFPKSITYAP